MEVLSHRGFWKTAVEKNKAVAFRHSFELKVGIETDVRDSLGQLVISHDPPTGGEMLFEHFLGIYTEYGLSLPLALNIKSDGLQMALKDILNKYLVRNYFVFDMSIPDALLYKREDFNVFTRQSEYEKEPSFYNEAQGVWLDEFHEHWINEEILNKHTKNGKKVCIVSPELHGRSYIDEWNDYKRIIARLGIPDIMICTDYPEEAKSFFNE